MLSVGRPTRISSVELVAGFKEIRDIIAAQGRTYVERFFDRAELARQYRKILLTPGRRPVPETAGAHG